MIRNLLDSERGTSLIEFAVVAPVLIFLLIGIVDVGRSMYYGILAASAARAGAQYGAQNLQTADDRSGMQAAANQDGQGVTWTVSAMPMCSVNGATLSICGSGALAPNTIYYVKVQVSGSFNTLIAYPGLPSSIPVSGTSVMRVISQ